MKTTARVLTENLLQNLWQQYLRRVSYARRYTALVTEKGGKVVPDHLAFRTLNTQTGEQPSGISAIRHLIEPLHYRQAGSYRFSRLMLSAAHFEHPDPALPKIFVSQLEVDQCPEWAQQMIRETVKDASYLLSDMAIELLNYLQQDGQINTEAAEILTEELTGYFRRPWNLPHLDDLLKINDVSQYAAWTLLHGNAVNHFAVLFNEQQVPDWPDLETTCRALAENGLPMKERIEGDKGSLVRQSATQAVKETFRLRDTSGNFEEVEWTYGYLELTERGFTTEQGKPKLFQGFLPDQVFHLFAMTQTRDN